MRSEPAWTGRCTNLYTRGSRRTSTNSPKMGSRLSGLSMPTRTRYSPGASSIDATARTRSGNRWSSPTSRPHAPVSWAVSCTSRKPWSNQPLAWVTTFSKGLLLRAPQAWRVMQYVQRPRHPDAMGTMASVLRTGSGRLPVWVSTGGRNMGSSSREGSTLPRAATTSSGS